MVGPEREEMLQVVDDDSKLDALLKRLDDERKAEMTKASRGAKKRGLSKDEYISKHAKVVNSFD